MDMNQRKPAIVEETNLVAMPSANTQYASILPLLTRGNLNGLSDEQIAQVYIARCDAMGVDARTQPFDILNLRGTKILYPNARLADQLIGQRNLSVETIKEETVNGMRTVGVRVSDGWRSVTATASLPVQGLSGEALGNAWMKCETKAVRRGVLRFCGLGQMPEVDQEDLRKAGLRRVHAAGADRGLDHNAIRAVAQEHYPALTSLTELDADDLAMLSDAIETQSRIADDDMEIEVDPETGEIMTDAPVTESDVIAAWQPVIEAAGTLDELNEVSAGIKDAGINSADYPELLRIFKARLNWIKIETAQANRAAQDAKARANAGNAA